MYRSLLLDNTTLWVLCTWLGALRYHVCALNQDLLVLYEDLEHLTLLALVLASEDNYLITFSNM